MGMDGRILVSVVMIVGNGACVGVGVIVERGVLVGVSVGVGGLILSKCSWAKIRQSSGTWSAGRANKSFQSCMALDLLNDCS